MARTLHGAVAAFGRAVMAGGLREQTVPLPLPPGPIARAMPANTSSLASAVHDAGQQQDRPALRHTAPFAMRRNDLLPVATVAVSLSTANPPIYAR